MTRLQIKACGITLVLALLSGCAVSPQVRRDKYLARGKALLQKSDYSRAILEFRNAAKAMPKDAEAYYQIGVASEDTGDVRTAVAFFRKTLDQNPKHSGAQLKLAQIMALTSDKRLLQDAETHLSVLKQGAPASPDILDSLALTELKLGKTEDAIEDLSEVLAKAPLQLRSSMMLSQAKLMQHDVKGAEEVLRHACEAAPNSADARVALGDFYLIEGRTTEAEEQFRRALDMNPKSWPALLYLTNLQRSLGRKQEAERSVRSLAASGEDRYKPLYAQFLFEEGRRDEAVREFEKLAKESPNDGRARTRLVVAYVQSGRNKDAENVLAGALRKNPKDVNARLEQGQILIYKGKLTEAEEDARAALRYMPDSATAHSVLAQVSRARGETLTAQQEFTESLRLNPNLLGVRLDLARLLLGSNLAAAALETMDHAPNRQKRTIGFLIERNEALLAMGRWEELRQGVQVGLSVSRDPVLLVQDAYLKIHQKDYRGARASIDGALEMDASNVHSLRALMQSYVAQNQVPAGLRALREYAAQHRGSASVQYYIGTVLMNFGHSGDARDTFEAAKVADSKLYSAELNLAELDIREGKLSSARARLSSLLLTRPNDPEICMYAGYLESEAGNYSQAIPYFRKVVAVDPSNARALNDLAYSLANDPNNVDAADEALKYAQQAKEISPNDPRVDDTIGWVLYQKGILRSAITYLENAASKSPDPAVHYHLALAYLKAGDNRGKGMLEAELKTSPDLPEAKIARQLLQQKAQ